MMSNKKIKSLPHDVLIITNDNEEIPCYKTPLCQQSTVFDTICSNTQYKETTSSPIPTITLPDVSSVDWKLFYSYISPPNPAQPPALDCNSVVILLPLFHKYDVNNWLTACDDFLRGIVVDYSTNDKHIDTEFISEFWTNGALSDRESTCETLLQSFQLAKTYNLSCCDVSANAVSGLLSHLRHTCVLFSPSRVFVLVDALQPLYGGDGEQLQQQNDEGSVANDPIEETRTIVGRMLHEEYDHVQFSQGDNAVFACMVHASIQREASELKLHHCRSSAAATIISAWEMFPRQLLDKVHEVTTDPRTLTAVRRGLGELFLEHKTDVREEEYSMLGVEAPSNTTLLVELARDAVIYFIKANQRKYCACQLFVYTTQLALLTLYCEIATGAMDIIQYASNFLSEEVDDDLDVDDTAKTNAIRDAIRWAVDKQYITVSDKKVYWNK